MKLNPFPTTPSPSQWYGVLGRRYDDYETAVAVAESISGRTKKAVSIMKKDADGLPSFVLAEVSVRDFVHVSHRRKRR